MQEHKHEPVQMGVQEMTVVFALLVLAVVVAGVVVVVKSPAPVPPESPAPVPPESPAPVPPESAAPDAGTIAAAMPAPLAAADLRQVRFPVVFRGYRMDEVDALLAKLAAQLEPSAPTGPPVIPGTEQPR